MLSRRALLKTLLGFGASFSALGAYAFGVEPMLRLSIVRHRPALEGWPSGLALRIVALADIHAGDPWMGLGRVEGLVRTANALEPDLIVLLGDYIAGWRLPSSDVDPAALATVLSGLSAPLGRYAILGNHDWWRDDRVMAGEGRRPFIRNALEGAGVPVLENDAVRLAKDGRPFWLAGLGDQIAFHWARRRLGRRVRRIGVDDIGAVLAQLSDDAPAILLAHEPDIFPKLPDRFALTLSGHTHGGQLNLFGWRPVAASKLSARYARGHFREGDRDLIVSSGLGCSVLPLRIGVPPEILVVELG